MPWYFYLALKQLFPTGKRLTFFTVISVLGVAAGVWLLIVVTGVMGGFGHKYRGLIVETQGDVQVRASSLVRDPAAVQKHLESIPGVAAATPFAEGIVMLTHADKPSFPGIQGVDLRRVEKVIPLRRHIVRGSIEDLDDDTVILSAGLADSLGAWVGSKVQVASPATLEKMQQDEVMLPAELTVVGIFQIGHQQLDSSVAIVTLRRMQDLYDLGRTVHGFNVKLAPGEDVIAATKRINASLPATSGLTARTWMEANESFLFALQMEKVLVTLLISAVVLVAAFLVLAMLLIAVVRKTREIGVLGSLGAHPRAIAAVFCLQGFLVGAVGAALGIGFGLLALGNMDFIFRTLGQLTGSWDDMVAIYQFTQVPAHITPRELALIGGYAVLMATLAGFIAAWRAARLKPVEALRSE
jgi:lipoprotein-releasing system permease protein